MADANKIYYPGVGGAFRIFMSENDNNISIIDFDNSLSELEKKFIVECAPCLGFQNNFSTFERQTFKAPVADCEWYNLTDDFLDIIKDIQIDIFDISGQKITFKQLRNAADATAKIRNKNFFYKIVHEISQDYLVEGWKIQKNINELINSSQFDFPCIIKSCQGKGGKGNLVCYNQRDFDQVYNIFLSDLFAKKQEINTYNVFDEIIIEKFFKNCPSYNLSFYCSINGNMMYPRVSEQIIDEVFYRGNIYPANLNKEQNNHMKKIGFDICQYINKKFQYFGWIGLDFINIDGKIFVIEANPRVNSVTHAHKLAKGNPFIIRLMQYKSADSINVAFNNFYFDRTTAIGVIPYQLPNSNEILLMSVATNFDDAVKNLDNFAEKSGLDYIKQQSLDGYSKSISYYLLKQK